MAEEAIPTIGSSVIPIVNKLHDILGPVRAELSRISLPHVAVVGSQSSGKSSVLEALVGRDFLPRGCDICTRRPLLLRLENRPSGDGREWGEFGHLEGKRFYDFSEIRTEIQAETERVAGFNKRVTDKEILLTISSPNVLNMTLIDLPGITKVPVGDQPTDIEARIRSMIMNRIKEENCIILAVTPGNSDLATSDALQMAKEADPSGSRTIGVITKLDIMDRGTDACNFLRGKVVPLTLGYVGVVNRCQKDINDNRSISDALAAEAKFFHDSPKYDDLSDRCGIPQLAKKLNQILEQHIRKVLPDFKNVLNRHLIDLEKELQKYGHVVETKAEQGAILLNVLTKFCDAFCAMMDGKNQEMTTKELSGGARIHYIFHSIFVKTLEEVDPCKNLSDEDIRTAIQNATGLRNSLFVPEIPFEYLIRRQIARLLDPSIQCLQRVYGELIKMTRSCEIPELQRFPAFRSRMDEITGKFLLDGVKPAARMIGNLIEMEMDYINSAHPNFIGGSKAVEIAKRKLRLSVSQDAVERLRSPSVLSRSDVNNQGHHRLNNEGPVGSGSNSSAMCRGISLIIETGENPAGESKSLPGDVNVIQLKELLDPSMLRTVEMTEEKKLEIVITKLLLQSYYDIVRKNIQDLVPKAIMHFLVNRTKRDLQSTFIQKLYRENAFEELLQEEDEVVIQRKRAREKFLVLQQALQMVEEVESDMSPRRRRPKSNMNATGLPKIEELVLSQTPASFFQKLNWDSDVGLGLEKYLHSGDQGIYVDT